MFRSAFVKAIKKGTEIKILMVDPDKKQSSAASLLARHQQTHNAHYDIIKSIKIVDQIRNEAGEDDYTQSQIKLRFMTFLPSCGLQISNPNSSEGKLRLSIYPIWVPTNHREIKTFKIIEKNQSPIAFEYFNEQFIKTWKDSKSEEAVKKQLDSAQK